MKAPALRFAIHSQRGYGDCSELRLCALGALSVDELVNRMRGVKRALGPKKRRRR
ncbi:MAG: hypothetical protein HYY06_30645 [Deltaproteobacteria bacterium]|nr:hypothetical protein [Deltaproteobacteria bacterium]